MSTPNGSGGWDSVGVSAAFGRGDRRTLEPGMDACTHVDQIREVAASADGCEDCLRIGDSWIHLRLCMTCGHVGCCDSSKNKHATAHFRQTGHPVIKSFEPGETWGWCYVDEVMLDARGWPVRGKTAHSR